MCGSSLSMSLLTHLAEVSTLASRRVEKGEEKEKEIESRVGETLLGSKEDARIQTPGPIVLLQIAISSVTELDFSTSNGGGLIRLVYVTNDDFIL